MTIRFLHSWSRFRGMVQKYCMPVLVIVMLNSCNRPFLESVPEVDVSRFEGEWFEISSYPTSFNKNCKCSKYDFKLDSESNYFKMIFSCIKKEKQGAFLAKAFFVEGSNNAEWRVQHFWPFRNDYFIILLDDNYRYAVIGNPDKDLLMVLAKNPEINEELYNSLLEKAATLGFDTGKLQTIPQNCD